MKAISFINMKGGVAKTTLAVNIADCMSERFNSRVVVIDIDPQFNATQCFLSGEQYVDHLEDQRDTIINVFDRTMRPTVGFVRGPGAAEPKELEDIKPIKIKPRLYLLPGALDLFRLEMAPGEGRENRLKRYIETLKDDYDYVIIDSPPTPSVWMTSALLASNYYVIPVKPDPISLTGIDLLYGIIHEKMDNFGLKIECLGLILTIAEENTVVYKNAVRQLGQDDRWKDLIFEKPFPKRTEVARLQLSQQTILSGNNSDLKRTINFITSEIIKRIDARV